MKTWSSTQAHVAMSSAEAELYALVKTAAEALGVQAIMADMGWNLRVRVSLDSSAAKAIASRTGLGRVRHVEVKFLWIQEAVRVGRVVVTKIPGKENPADVLTKPVSVKEAVDRGLYLKMGATPLRRRWADMEDDE